MPEQQEKIKLFLETFFKATQVEALYFDRNLNATSCSQQRYLLEQFQSISQGELEGFLSQGFDKQEFDRNVVYTYYLKNNLVSNVVFLSDAAGLCCAAATEPVALAALRKAELEATPDNLPSDGTKRTAYLAAVLRAPVVSHDRIAPMGKALAALSRSLLEETSLRQVIRGQEDVANPYRALHTAKGPPHRYRTPSPGRHGGYSIYLKLKNAITKGDAEELRIALQNFDFGSINSSKTTVRSIKNSLIEGCAMSCFIAVEAGVPYNKARKLTEEAIYELEETENIYGMYQILKSTLLAFTRAVALTHIIGYSKPVRMAMEYIDTHYAEKITLKLLAEHVNLSEFYLSNLIKKETGCNISDIVNRVRIEESKKILLKEPVSVAALAGMVGFRYSNHFSKIFRQYAGVSPSEYAKTIAAASVRDAEAMDIARMLLDQLNQSLSLFPVFDVGRIVDPALNVSWRVQRTGEVTEDACYSLWDREERCAVCVTSMALAHNRPFVKLEQSGVNRFLVFALPVPVGNRNYVIELLKNVNDNYFDCTQQ